MRVLQRSNELGFTLIELLIATLVFSIILLGTTVSLIKIGKLYHRGIIYSKTQAAARAVTDELSQGIQYSGETPIMTAVSGPSTPTGVSAICFGKVRYAFLPNTQVTYSSPNSSLHQGYHGLWRDSVNASCGGDTVRMDMANPPVAGAELIGEHMRLADLSVTNASGSSMYTVNIKIIYGDDDLIEFVDAGGAVVAPTAAGARPNKCKGGDSSDWCAVSELNTTVVKRVK